MIRWSAFMWRVATFARSAIKRLRWRLGARLTDKKIGAHQKKQQRNSCVDARVRAGGGDQTLEAPIKFARQLGIASQIPRAPIRAFLFK